MIDACKQCPMRLFNSKHYNLQGIGNNYSNNCIVIPNVDYNAYIKGSIEFSKQIDIIKDILSSSMGELEILNHIYIIPLIRCCDKLGCEITNNIYNNCIIHFTKDIRKYDFHNILLLGDSANKFLNCNIKDNLNTIFISKNNRYYNVNFSPLIKYTNEDRFELFKTYLIRWYFSAINYNYSGYKIEMI